MKNLGGFALLVVVFAFCRLMWPTTSATTRPLPTTEPQAAAAGAEPPGVGSAAASSPVAAQVERKAAASSTSVASDVAKPSVNEVAGKSERSLTLREWRKLSIDDRWATVNWFLRDRSITMDATDTKLVIDCISEFAARPKRNKGVDVNEAAGTCIKVPAMTRQLLRSKELSEAQ